MANNILKFPVTQSNRLRLGVHKIHELNVGVSEFLSFCLLRTMGYSLDELKEKGAFTWVDKMDNIERLYQDERSQPHE